MVGTWWRSTISGSSVAKLPICVAISTPGLQGESKENGWEETGVVRLERGDKRREDTTLRLIRRDTRERRGKGATTDE